MSDEHALLALLFLFVSGLHVSSVALLSIHGHPHARAGVRRLCVRVYLCARVHVIVPLLPNVRSGECSPFARQNSRPPLQLLAMGSNAEW